MTRFNVSELLNVLATAVDIDGLDAFDRSDLANWTYIPHPRLSHYLTDAQRFRDGQLVLSTEDAGKLMEQVAACLFEGLQQGGNSISVRTADGQLDLYKPGSTSVVWNLLVRDLLGLAPPRNGLLVECKCYQPPEPQKSPKRVPQKEYARLGGLVTVSMSSRIAIAVMLSLWGGSTGNTKVALQDSKLFRVKFHCHTGIPMLDLTLREVETTALEYGGLVRLLRQKIDDLAVLSDLGVLDPGTPSEARLPEHQRVALDGAKE